MKKIELEDYQAHGINLDGEESLVENLTPILKDLVQTLLDLPEKAPEPTVLECFKKCIFNINNFEDEIETVERESVLEHIYAIGEIVGLDPTSEYAEEWRGDW